MSMDQHWITALLSDDINYEDIGKSKFIDKLKRRFSYHKKVGDTELFLELDVCKSCNCNYPVCKFTGNNSGKHFGLFFDFKKDQIIDIYHCNLYGSNTNPLF